MHQLWNLGAPQKFIRFFGCGMGSLKRENYQSNQLESRDQSKSKEEMAKPTGPIYVPGHLGTLKDQRNNNVNRSWLSNGIAVFKQLQKILNSEKAITTWKDLRKHHPGQVGSMDSGIILFPSDHLFNPSNFYMIFDRAEYSFQNPGWTEYFPPFQSGTQAYRDLHILLNIYYKMSEENTPNFEDGASSNSEQFVAGQLVLVKFMKRVEDDPEAGDGEEGTDVFQMRRGVIRDVRKGENGELKYSVLLMDFGFFMDVSVDLLFYLPKPFNFIAPLAINCKLYGVSPVGQRWSKHAMEIFTDYLLKQSDSTFFVDILADIEMQSGPIAVNVDIRRFKESEERGKRLLVFTGNLSEFVIDMQLGAQWNLFPSRPKLMGGATPQPKSGPIPTRGQSEKPSQVSIPFRDALLLAPVELPRLYEPLPLAVIEREIFKLFYLRSNQLHDIKGHTHYLATQRNHDKYVGTPATLNSVDYPPTPPMQEDNEEVKSINSEGNPEKKKKLFNRLTKIIVRKLNFSRAPTQQEATEKAEPEEKKVLIPETIPEAEDTDDVTSNHGDPEPKQQTGGKRKSRFVLKTLGRCMN